MKEKPVEPRCPDRGCKALVGRPKCFWELPPNECPRHPLAHKWRAEMREWEAMKKPEPVSVKLRDVAGSLVISVPRLILQSLPKLKEGDRLLIRARPPDRFEVSKQ